MTDTDDRTPLGARIMRARVAADLSQYRLAILLDVTPTTVQGWERGRTEPRVSDLERIATATRAPLGWLATGEGHGPAERAAGL